MEIIIPVNRKRIPWVLIVSSLFTIALVIAIIDVDNSILFLHGVFNWIYFGLLFFISCFFLFLSLIEYLKTSFDKKACLIINKNGIDDNLSIFSYGMIEWKELTKIEMRNHMNTNFLVLKVINNERYLVDKNLIIKFVLRKYIKRFGTPIIISENKIAYDIIELNNLLNRYFQAH